MTIKHILVHLDQAPHNRSRLAFALELAHRHGAFVSGCYLTNSPERQRTEAELRGSFLEQTDARDLAAEWLSLPEAESRQAQNLDLCRLACCADLIIVGQPDPHNNPKAARELIELLLLQSGRPVLILPYAGEFDPHCERVLVAWSGGRESSRALHDALPLLQKARQVNLLSLVAADASGTDVQDSLTLLCRHLVHHGIAAHPETQICLEVSKGDMLLNRCAEEGTGLLVAGACSREHLSEIAGHLLKHMTVPVLLAH